jgi:hypothetical protein
MMKTLGLAGLAVAVGYLFQSKSGSKKLRSVSRELRSIAGSVGDELTRIGRSVGLVDDAAAKSGSRKRQASGSKKKAKKAS